MTQTWWRWCLICICHTLLPNDVLTTATSSPAAYLIMCEYVIRCEYVIMCEYVIRC